MIRRQCLGPFHDALIAQYHRLLRLKWKPCGASRRITERYKLKRGELRRWINWANNKAEGSNG